MHSTTPSQPPTARPAKKPGLLINRNYALLFSGHAVSIIGDFAFSTTLAVWVFTLTQGQPWAPLAVTGVFLATALPVVLVGPIAGVFVDRADKRRTMLLVDALRVVLVAALILVTVSLPLGQLAVLPPLAALLPSDLLASGQLPLEWRLAAVYAVVFVVMACEQFFRPAMVSLIGDLVPDAYRGRAVGLGQSATSVALLLGTLVAPALVVTVGPQWALLFDALSFVVSYLTVRAIRAPAAARSVPVGARGHFGREFAAGVRSFAASRVSIAVLVSGVILMLGGGALNSLDIFFATGNLHVGLPLYGLLGAVYGVGLLLGSVLASFFVGRLGYARTLWAAQLGLGVLILVYSRLSSFGPALALLGIMGMVNAALNVAIGPLVLAVTPRTMVGRRMALLNPAMSVADLGGTALAGYLAGSVLAGFSASGFGLTFGPVDTILASSGVLGLLGAAYCALTLRTRTVERERAAKAAADAVGVPQADVLAAPAEPAGDVAVHHGV